MLAKLIEHLKTKSLPFYWDSKYNMFSAIDENKLKGLLNNMEGIQKTVSRYIETKPDELYSIFCK